MDRLAALEAENAQLRQSAELAMRHGLWLEPSPPRPVAGSKTLHLAPGLSASAVGPTSTALRVIEGDNLDAVAAVPDLYGTTSLVVMDPPYNTGRELGYHDRRTSRTGWRHGDWATWMLPRLEAARDLLDPETGMCALFIDERELPTLRLLADRVFGEANRASQITVRSKQPAGFGQAGFLVDVCEQILIYARSKAARKNSAPYEHEPLTPAVVADYRYELRSAGTPDPARTVTTDDGRSYTIWHYPEAVVAPLPSTNRTPAHAGPIADRLFRSTNAQAMTKLAVHLPRGIARVRYTPASGPYAGTERTMWFHNQRLCAFLSAVISDVDGVWMRRTRATNLWVDNYHQALAAEGGVSFPNGKKPVKLLRRLLDIQGSRDGTIVDLFAGSGSTGEAVARANEADGGTRNAVCVTSAEEDIARRVCYPRLVGVITGQRPDGRVVSGTGGTVDLATVQ